MLLAVCLPQFYAAAADTRALLAAEERTLDAAAADPDVKLTAVNLIAARLQEHPNHIMLLRRQTGKSLAQVFIAELRKRGESDAQIVSALQTVNRELEASAAGAGDGSRPVLLVRTGVDRYSGGTIFSFFPEAGWRWANASAVIGAPVYAASGTPLKSRGLGDVYATGSVFGSAQRADFRGALTVGFPTGDRDRGLGAGKTTFDLTGGAGAAFGRARLFGDAGVANSVFNNAGYQRPYVETGNAFHAAGGAGFRVAPGVEAGAAAFALRPWGTQQVYSRVAETATAQPMPGRSANRKKPIFQQTPVATVEAADMRDHGVNAWLTVRLHRAVWLEGAVARSVPFQLTIVHFGLGFDLGALIR
ncbi:MAG: hypothetical protein ACE15B_04310 [Bryobacteraceae bacterium]